MRQHANEGERSEPEEEGTAQGLAHGRRPPRQERAETDNHESAGDCFLRVRVRGGVPVEYHWKAFVFGAFGRCDLEIGRRYYCTAYSPRICLAMMSRAAWRKHAQACDQGRAKRARGRDSLRLFC